MSVVRGKNIFDGVFDFFEWSAKYYMKPIEIKNVLDSSHVYGKVIKKVNVIGIAHLSFATDLSKMITGAGMELKDGWWESDGPNLYPHLDDIRIPWRAEACEPIQFVFEDGTTLEILPIGGGAARIGVNSIPKGLVEGLNHSDFDANCFFAEAIGKKINGIGVVTEKKETYDYWYGSRYEKGKKP